MKNINHCFKIFTFEIDELILIEFFMKTIIMNMHIFHFNKYDLKGHWRSQKVIGLSRDSRKFFLTHSKIRFIKKVSSSTSHNETQSVHPFYLKSFLHINSWINFGNDIYNKGIWGKILKFCEKKVLWILKNLWKRFGDF